MALVRIAWLPHGALELDSATLLDDVSGFVRRGVQVRGTIECDGVAERVRRRAKIPGGTGSRSPLVSLHAGNIVTPEARLDRLEVRQRRARAVHAASRDIGDGCAVLWGGLIVD
jgi:hypothetical protein